MEKTYYLCNYVYFKWGGEKNKGSQQELQDGFLLELFHCMTRCISMMTVHIYPELLFCLFPVHK